MNGYNLSLVFPCPVPSRGTDTVTGFMDQAAFLNSPRPSIR
ncbi:MAG: hypothetical protein JWO38_2232 [Gemmataceae bacterium]|nr:hypothetical protein [Gemmataceae bacterium]